MTLARKWRSEEMDRLYELLAEGKQIREIATALDRTPGSVRGIIQRHRLRRTARDHRPCLTCGQHFLPDSRFNRICGRCKDSDAWKSEGEYWLRL